MDLETFAERLKTLRQSAGLSRKQLAEQARLTERAITAWEQAYREPGILAVCALAEALGVEVAALLEEPKKGRKGKKK
jgi:transcriptional regulator with XRE-family HTH domain